MLGFLGPNGAGKTTTMRAIFGLVEPDAGAVLWDGRPIGLAERLRFGYMPEERGLYPRMPVGEQLAYFGRLHGLDARGADAAASDWLDAARPRRACRREAGRALARQPAARPARGRAACTSRSCSSSTSRSRGSIPVAVRTLAEVLRGEAARGAAVLFSSHQLELVEDICEEVAIIDRGRIVADGQPRRAEARLGAPADRAASSTARRRSGCPRFAGVELVERRNGDLRLLVDRDVDPEPVLAAAERTGAGGRVQLRAAVARGAVPGAGGAMSAPTRDHPRRHGARSASGCAARPSSPRRC